MYFVWQQRLFLNIETLDHQPLDILHPGLRNYDAGPDFFNAKVKEDGIVWAGNVEMHVKAGIVIIIRTILPTTPSFCTLS